MKCPYCRATETEVYNSRSTRFETQIWRRRRCLNCNKTFTTYESPDLGFLKVKKRRVKRPQRYSRAKLFSSIYGAFAAAATRDETVDAVTDTVESRILDLKKTPVATEEIAGIVLQTLKRYSTTAFVRYLSKQTDIASEAQLRRELKKY